MPSAYNIAIPTPAGKNIIAASPGVSAPKQGKTMFETQTSFHTNVHNVSEIV